MGTVQDLPILFAKTIRFQVSKVKVLLHSRCIIMLEFSTPHPLIALGWDDFFAGQFAPFAQEGYEAGRVTIQHKGAYTLATAHGELRGEITGKMLYFADSPLDFPAVGDWVAIRPRLEESAATIHEVLPRKSKFVRKAPGEKVEEQVVAANVDNVFLVTGLDGDYNLKRLERYLVLAWESGANPIVILNKIDLCPDLPELLREVESVALGVPVLTMSALDNEGVETMRPYLGPGKTGALLGSSGVGKSTIINQLLGKDRQKVKEVRATDSRGRHTTTYRELILLPFGGMLMDTPGMRELQLWGSGEGLGDTFEDILALAAQCRFRDCQHQAEPGCAVQAALEDGTLDIRRYESYLKLQKEIAYQNRKGDLMAELKLKEQWKKIHAAHKRSYRKK